MFYIILIALFSYIFIYIIKNKIHIRFKTFFKRGFKKTDNKFRPCCFYAVSRGPEKLIPAYLTVWKKN